MREILGYISDKEHATDKYYGIYYSDADQSMGTIRVSTKTFKVECDPDDGIRQYSEINRAYLYNTDGQCVAMLNGNRNGEWWEDDIGIMRQSADGSFSYEMKWG